MSEPSGVDTRPAPLVCLGDAPLNSGYGRPLRPALARSFQEQDFSSAFEHSAVGMALVAPDSRRLRVNQAFCDMLGYSRVEMLSLSVVDITHPDDVAEHRDQWARILAGEKASCQREMRYLHKSGRVVWAHLTCSLIRNADGSPAHFVVQVLDITERKAAEQGLRDTQAMLHLAAQIGRLGAWSYDLVDSRMVWSEEICAIHEVKRGFRPTPDEAIEFFASEQREAMRSIVHACLRDGSPFDVEAPIVTAKGQKLWTRVIGEAEWDAQGRVRRIHGACQDISEARRVAADARQLADQLATTLESLTDAFFTIDRNWRFTYLNSEAERVFRASRRDLLGKSLGDVLPAALGSIFHHHLERAMSDQVVVQCEEHYAPYNAWVQVKAYPSAQGLTIYVKDVTERVVAQQEVLRLNAELENRVKERTRQLEVANGELAVANKEMEAFSTPSPTTCVARSPRSARSARSWKPRFRSCCPSATATICAASWSSPGRWTSSSRAFCRWPNFPAPACATRRSIWRPLPAACSTRCRKPRRSGRSRSRSFRRFPSWATRACCRR